MASMQRGVLCTLIVALALAGAAIGQTADPEAAIRKVMQAQVDAWNHHDLEGFMAGYWNSPELTFFSGGTVSHGWQAALDVAADFWLELHAWARGMLREIHTLARAYGWREADILALSPARRRHYLQLVLE